MNLYEMTKMYGKDKGEPMMWDVIAVVSDAVEASMPEAEKRILERKIYGKLSGGHYNEQYATEDVAKRSYRDPRTGMVRKAPYWTADMVRGIYDSLKGDLRGYNCWDFYVTLNMIATDNAALLYKWFPNIYEKEQDQKLVEMAVNWLNDDDNPYGGSKIWCYMNA